MDVSTRVVKFSEGEGKCSWMVLARIGFRAMVSITMRGIPVDVRGGGKLEGLLVIGTMRCRR